MSHFERACSTVDCRIVSSGDSRIEHVSAITQAIVKAWPTSDDAQKRHYIDWFRALSWEVFGGERDTEEWPDGPETDEEGL